MATQQKPKQKPRSFELTGAKPLQEAFLYSFGGTIAILLGGISLQQPQARYLQCERAPSQAGICQLTSLNFFNQTVRTFPIEHLEGARVQRRGKEKSVVLLLRSSEPITMPSQLSIAEVEQAQDQVNEFVSNSNQKNLVIKQYDSHASFKAFLGITVGGIMLLLAKASLTKWLSNRSRKKE